MGKMQKIAVVISLFLQSTLMAQVVIRGQVLDENEVSLPYANVLLFRVSDSSLLKGSITDEEGYFRVEYNDNSMVFIRVVYLGYKDFESPGFEPRGPIDMGPVILEPDSEMLQEVEVTDKRPLFEQRIDRTIVNVQNSLTNIGNNVLNVLGKSPSVTINRTTGEIGLMGKQGVLVMIDDRLVRMESADLMNLLENMPADNVDSIELITSPPASYDAQGNAGIINIKTIRQENEGFSGRLTANVAYGERFKYGGSLNSALNKKEFYLFANLSATVNYDLERVSLFMDYLYPDNRVISDMSVLRKPKMGLFSGELGIDYHLDDKTVIGGLVTVNGMDWEMDATSRTRFINELSGSSEQTVVSYEENKYFRALFNLNLRHRFSESGQLKLDLDHIRFQRNNPTLYHASTAAESGNIGTEDFISDSDTPLNINVIKADYEAKLTDKIHWQAGLKTTLADFTNDVRVAYLDDGSYVDDPQFTDIYQMEEFIYAAYTSLDWEISSSLLLKTGLRFENYGLELNSINQGALLDSTNKRLFPSVFLNYRPNDQSEWNASFVERIERPGFLDLAPYFYFFNPTTLFTGNTNLIPSLSKQYKLDYQYGTLNLSVQYSNAKLPVFNWQPAKDDTLQLALFRPEQGIKNQVVSLSASIPWRISGWWSSRYSILGYLKEQTPLINNREVTRKNSSLVFTTTHDFQLGNQWELGASFQYNSPFYEGVAVTATRTILDLGISKKFGSGASLTFNVNDIFDKGSQWPIEASLPGQGAYYDWTFDAEGPVFRLNFTMPLGNQKIKEKTKRSSGSSEEQERLE